MAEVTAATSGRGQMTSQYKHPAEKASRESKEIASAPHSADRQAEGRAACAGDRAAGTAAWIFLDAPKTRVPHAR
eukprot:6195253-Pleurochrysis_carterae.AAC.1